MVSVSRTYLSRLQRVHGLIRRTLSLAACTIVAASALLAQQNAKDNVKADAILVHGKAILLFTRMAACDDNFVPGASQLLVSTDGGRSWQKRGPRLEGYEFDSVSVRDGKVWIAGEHTAEGPAIEPFVFVPAKSPLHWEMRTIYQGAGGLERVAWGSKGELIAWVPHLKLEDDWKGPTYIHQSLDEGRTWKTLGRARKLKMEKGIEFTGLEKLKDPLWRIINSHYETDYRVQHREAENAPWKTVTSFVHRGCP